MEHKAKRVREKLTENLQAGQLIVKELIGECALLQVLQMLLDSEEAKLDFHPGLQFQKFAAVR